MPHTRIRQVTPGGAGLAALLLPVVLLVGLSACSSDDAEITQTTPPAGVTSTAAVDRDPTTTDTTAAVTDLASDVIIRASYAFGEVTVEQATFEVALGQTVGLVVTSDVAEELRVGGYDLSVPIEAGGTGEIELTADTPGVFEVQLASSGTFLFEIAVD